MTRALVTGGTGFVGRHAVRALQQRGWEVHGLTSRADVPPETGVAWHQVDLLQPGAVRAVIDRVHPSHLLHCAWDVTPGRYASSIGNLAWARASLELLEAFGAAGGRRAVMVGTCFEYDGQHGFCSEAITPIQPATLYGVAKDSVRRLSEAYARQTGVALVWARLFYLYGPHEHPSRLVSSVILALLRGEPARCSHGRQIRDFLHVADVGAALAATLESPVTGAVNIASGQPLAIRDLVHTVADRLGARDRVQLGAIPAAAGEPPLIVGDARRLTDEVGWRPTFDLGAGIDDAIAWWTEEGRRQKAEGRS